ncbi:hypothetical protein [Bacillus coahuilensis]|nr:hypothetical protein [Bacillus coahuilensis]
MWYIGIGLLVIGAISLFGALGRTTLRGSNEQQLQELDRIKSQT